MIDWFNSKSAEEFGDRLALHYHERLATIGNANMKKTADKQHKLLQEIRAMALEFKTGQQGVNMYKKAKLANAFKWKLRDLGYEGGQIDQLAKEILLAMQ